MITLIVAVALTLIGVIGMRLFWNKDVRFVVDLTYVSALSFGAVMLLCSLIIFIDARVGVDQKVFEARLLRGSIIEQVEELKDQENSPMVATVIQDVRNWNIEVSRVKYWAGNPWTNIFWSTRYVDAMEYVDMDDYL